MDLQLKGKRALVTGASRGLGYATARGLAMEGCRVAVNGWDAYGGWRHVQRYALRSEGKCLQRITYLDRSPATA